MGATVATPKDGLRVNRRKGPGSTASVLALLAGMALAQPAVAQQTGPSATSAARHIDFNIPAQDLNGAILAFAAKAGIQVFYDVSKVQGMHSAGVSGNLTPQDALASILTGTGLTYHFTGPKTVSLDRLAAQDEGHGGVAFAPLQGGGAGPPAYG